MHPGLRLLVLGSLIAMSGCTALAIGGAAAGGYVVGKDERGFGQIVDDGTITASVKTKLFQSKYIEAGKVDVDTYEGVVTLNGRVSSYVAREHAEALATDTKGVKSVLNKLEVVPPAVEES